MYYMSMTNQQFVIYLAKCYLAKSCDEQEYNKILKKDLIQMPECYDSEKEPKGITYYRVGHNSDTCFDMGFDAEDNLYCRASGADYQITIPKEEYYALLDSSDEKDWERAYQAEKMVTYTNVRQVTQDRVEYIGHW